VASQDKAIRGIRPEESQLPLSKVIDIADGRKHRNVDDEGGSRRCPENEDGPGRDPAAYAPPFAITF